MVPSIAWCQCGCQSLDECKYYCSQQLCNPFHVYLSSIAKHSRVRTWFLHLKHPYIRTGVEFCSFGSDIHMGMLNYITTERIDENGVSFWPTSVGDHVSFGQRCVAMSGCFIGASSTVGAETLIPHDFDLKGGGTTFGSPPVQFHSSMSHDERVNQLRRASNQLSVNEGDVVTELLPGNVENTSEESKGISRRQDVGKEMFWTYIVVMLVLQAAIPAAIGGSYALLFWAATVVFGDIQFYHVLMVSPLIYLFGSLVLMLVLKVLQAIGGGFSVGTSNFFSVQFLYWHLLADMIYFCTSTVLYPLSGTVSRNFFFVHVYVYNDCTRTYTHCSLLQQIYCIWLRFMGAKIGKNVFISPENGGFREIDFMNIGNDCGELISTCTSRKHFFFGDGVIYVFQNRLLT